MSSPRTVVVGAGIAGLTLAVALTRQGHEVHLLEQAAELAEVGAGVQLAPNATRLLHRLGLGEHLRRVAVRPESVDIRRWDDGRLLARTVLGDRCEDMYGAPYYAVHRADLQTGLRDLLPTGMLRLGRRCTGVVRHGGRPGLVVDGRVRPAGLIVGADGVHSAVRGSLVADHPRFSGHAVFRGLVPADRVTAASREPVVQVWLGPGRHCVMYPVSAGAFLNVVATVPAPEPGPESWGREGRHQELVAAYTGWHEQVTSALDTLTAPRRWPLFDRDTTGRWGADRVVLIGDAAHPMLPFMAQGATMAIEDAVVLATELGAGDRSDPADALLAFEGARQRRTARVHADARTALDVLHLLDGAEQRARDAAMPAVHALPRKAWLYGHDAEEPAPVR